MAAKRQMRYLIVNADDFGRSPGINRGIIEAHENGIVTSASLMVRWPAAVEAAAYARKHQRLSVGLHFDLGEWACRAWTWVQLYRVVAEDNHEAVAKEASRQLTAFRRLIGRDPTHIDSHQHCHLEGPARTIMAELAHKLGVPLRSCTPGVRYSGHFYGQNEHGYALPDFIGVDALIKILRKLPPGITELGCHAGLGNDLDSMYLSERALEVRTLCNPRVRAAIVDMGINLCSFRDVRARRSDAKPLRRREPAI